MDENSFDKLKYALGLLKSLKKDIALKEANLSSTNKKIADKAYYSNLDTLLVWKAYALLELKDLDYLRKLIQADIDKLVLTQIEEKNGGCK